jgi:hypothetical protein
MKTKTQLQIDFAYLSWNYDFPVSIDKALEHDYVCHPHLYDESTLKRVAALLLIFPNSTDECALQIIRS